MIIDQTIFHISFFKVNNANVTRMECTQVVPLLASSPDELTLVVGRRPAPMFDETDELYDLDEDETHSNDANIWNSSMNTNLHENSNHNSNNSTNNHTFTLLSQAKTSTV